MKQFWASFKQRLVPWLPLLAYVLVIGLTYFSDVVNQIMSLVLTHVAPKFDRKVSALDFGPLLLGFSITYLIYWIAVVLNLVRGIAYRKQLKTTRGRFLAGGYVLMDIFLALCLITNPLVAVTGVVSWGILVEGSLPISVVFCLPVVIISFPILDILLRRKGKKIIIADKSSEVNK